MGQVKQFVLSKNAIGYIEVAPKPCQQDLTKLYKEHYFQNAKGSYSKDYSSDEEGHRRATLSVAEFFVRREVGVGALLDLGCGEGFFSKFFFDAGWSVTCADLSDFGVRQHNIGLIHRFIQGDVREVAHRLKEGGSKFDVINLQHVLEHIDSPEKLLFDIRQLLSKNALVRIKVPNDFSDFQNLLTAHLCTMDHWVCPPEHLNYFNKDSLARLLEFSGYKVVSLQADFPIEVFLLNSHSNYVRDKSKGKQAHLARILCESHLINQSISDYIDFTEACAKLGFGRSLIAYAQTIK